MDPMWPWTDGCEVILGPTTCEYFSSLPVFFKGAGIHLFKAAGFSEKENCSEPIKYGFSQLHNCSAIS